MLKLIDISSLESDEIIKLRKNLMIIKALNHVNLPTIYDAFIDEKYAYVIMEFIEGVEIFDHII